MRRERAIILAGVFMLFMVWGAAAPVVVRAESAQKDIRVEEREDRLEVAFSANKRVYAVDEPISFEVETNRDAYIYLFNLDEDSERVTMLYPNAYDEGNRVRAHSTVTIPSKSEFKAGNRGIERVVLVASTRKLDVNKRSIANSNFYGVAKADFKEISKAIRVSTNDRREEDRIVKELEIKVK